MTQQKPQFSLEAAEEVAEGWLNGLRAYCERIEVAGSIRRGRPTVGDIELLCVPKMGNPPTNMFSEPHGPPVNLLTDRLDSLIHDGYLAKRPNKAGHFTYGEKNKLLIDVQSGMPIDVFTTDEIDWGMALVVRTGPKDFNVRMMVRFKALGMNGHVYGGVSRPRSDGRPGNETVNCPDEATVFSLLQWVYQQPEVRT